MLEKFLPRQEFDSYEDFKANYKVNIPENFNFGFDIVDGWAQEKGSNRALVWCDDNGNEKVFTFEEMSRLSNQAANYFKSLGLKKGSVAMLILRQRWEYWICATALIKLGVIFIPGTLQLTKKDIVYRANAAQVEMIICVDDDYVINQVEAAHAEMPSVQYLLLVNDKERAGWLSFNKQFQEFSDTLARPTGDDAPKTPILCRCILPAALPGCPNRSATTTFTPWGTS